MPLYALVNGERARATPDLRDAGVHGSCLECAALMQAKTGNVKIHHWAHLTADPNCAAGHESMWHLEWKAEGLDGTQEVAVGNRRADVLAPGGWAVEFQASPLTAEEVQAREDDWGRKLVWIMHARKAYEEGRLNLRVPGVDDCPWRCGIYSWPAGEKHVHFRWSHAPERTRRARCPLIIDAGPDELVYVETITKRDGGPMIGWGQRMTRQEVVERVLKADELDLPRTPLPPPKPLAPATAAPQRSRYNWALIRATRTERGCHRWLDEEDRWCNSADIAGDWLAGPLCSLHAPQDTSRMVAASTQDAN